MTTAVENTADKMPSSKQNMGVAIATAGVAVLLQFWVADVLAGIGIEIAAVAGRHTQWLAIVLSPVLTFVGVFLATWWHVRLVRRVFAGRKSALVAAIVEGGVLVVATVAMMIAGAIGAIKLAMLGVPSVLMRVVVAETEDAMCLAIAAAAIVQAARMLARGSADRSLPPTPRAVAGSWYAEDLCLAGAAVGIILGTLSVVTPACKEIFKDFRTTLPAPTEFVINVSSWMSDWPGAAWLAAILAAAVIPLPLLAQRWSRPPTALAARKTWKLAGVTIALTMVAVLPVIAAVLLPMIKLIGSFSGGEAGKGE